MNERIQDISLVPSNYRRKRARAPREEGAFFGVARAACFAALAGACLGAFACNSPTPQSGTNTNWSCTVDVDCTRLSSTARCDQGFCKLSSTRPDAGEHQPCATGACPQADASAPDTFVPSQVSATPTMAGLSSVAATDTGWVAVGMVESWSPRGPVFYTSSDARTWTSESLPINVDALGDVAFGNGTIVVVGGWGILTKPPGGSWQTESSDGGTYRRVLFGNGTFFVESLDSGARVSSDGLTWVETESAMWTGFLDDEFVQFGINTAGYSRFRTSPNARAWSSPTEETWPQYDVQALARVGGQILGFGDTYCFNSNCDRRFQLQLLGSAGAPLNELVATEIDWEVIPSRSIATDGNHVVASTDKGIRTTTLPIGSAPWSDVEVPVGTWVSKIVFAHGTFVAVGTLKTSEWASELLVLTSADGTTWLKVAM